MGAITTSVVADTIQPHYSKKLLEKAIPLLALQQTAVQEELPANIGATSIRFYRPPAPDLTQTGAPAALSQGVAPTNFREIAYTPIDVTLTQRGQVSKVTDIANNVGLLKYLDTAIDLMTEEFILDMDNLIRNPLCSASTNSGAAPTNTGLTKRYAQGLADFAGTAAASLANAKIVPRDLLDACTRLTLNRAPTFGGKYTAHLPSQLIRDLLEDSTFREVVRQSNASKIFNREVGDYYGCKIVENTNPFQEDNTEGTYAATHNVDAPNTTGLIYTAIITGKGAYGTVNMKKMGSTPFKPQVVIVDKPDSGNPLAQYIIAGWKSYNAQVTLNGAWGIALRAKTQFVA